MIDIRITDNAPAILAKVKNLADRGMGAALAAELDHQNELTASHIVERRMSGPSGGEILGVVTGRARRSIRRTNATISGNTITSSIGSNVNYVGIHEFGYTGPQTVQAHTRRVASRSVRGQVDGKTRKVAQGIAFVRSFTRQVDVPEKAMIRRGIADRREVYGAGLSRAVVEAYNS